MHKLMEYICNELEEIERKADKEGKLSMTEIEYADKLASMKKNLLKAEEMWDESEYSMASGRSYMRGSYEGGGGSYTDGGRGSSYARGGRRGGRRGGANQYGSYAGGYSRASEDLVMELRELMKEAPDDRIRQEMQSLIQRVEQM